MARIRYVAWIPLGVKNDETGMEQRAIWARRSVNDAQINGGLSRSAHGASGARAASLRIGAREKQLPDNFTGCGISTAMGMQCMQFP